MPTNWKNPGAYGQLERVPEAVLLALPPPRRPLWPQPVYYLTLRYASALAVALCFAVLAAYLQAKQRLRGSARAALEKRAPALALALANLGLLADLGAEGSLDRSALCARIVARFADEEGAGLLPLARAIALLATLRGELWEEENGAVRTPAAAAVALKSAGVAVAAAPAPTAPGRNALTLSAVSTYSSWLAGAAGSSSPAGLTRAQAAEFLRAGTADMRDALLRLASADELGLPAVSPAAWVALGDLYDNVVGSRSAGSAFSPRELAELAGDVGFAADAKLAARALANGAASTGRSSGDVSAATDARRLSRDEFSDFMATAAAAAQVDDSRMPDYVRVFFLLHMSGMREAAGVASSGGR